MTDLEEKLLIAFGFLWVARHTSLVDRDYLLLSMRTAGLDDKAIHMLNRFTRKRLVADE